MNWRPAFCNSGGWDSSSLSTTDTFTLTAETTDSPVLRTESSFTELWINRWTALCAASGGAASGFCSLSTTAQLLQQPAWPRKQPVTHRLIKIHFPWTYPMYNINTNKSNTSNMSVQVDPCGPVDRPDVSYSHTATVAKDFTCGNFSVLGIG